MTIHLNKDMTIVVIHQKLLLHTMLLIFVTFHSIRTFCLITVMLSFEATLKRSCRVGEQSYVLLMRYLLMMSSRKHVKPYGVTVSDVQSKSFQNAGNTF